jgi:hypothetical protein
VLANLLRLIEEMAAGAPGEVPDGSELLAAEPGPPSTLAVAADRAQR